MSLSFIHILATTTLGIFSYPSTAQHGCDLRDAQAISGPLGYQPRAKGSYCEGIVEGTNSSAVELSVISFSKGPVNFFPSDAEVLTIRALTGTGTPVQVHARNFNMATRYRFDCDLVGGTARELAAATVIAKIPIPKENFGVYGRGIYEGEEAFIPVQVSTRQWPPRATAPYVLLLAKNVGFRFANYRYARLTKTGEEPSSEVFPISLADTHTERLALAMPFAMTAGVYRLRITYELTNGHLGNKSFLLQLP